MAEFHFLRPGWFFALLPLLFLLVWLWRRRVRSTGWQQLVAPALLAHLLLDADQTVRRVPWVLLGCGWLLAVTALAGPTWERQPQPVYRAPADRVIVLDMSPSMAAADLKPDRLTRARFAIRNLLSAMREGRVALVVFGAEPHVVAPLTDDVATIEALLPALSVDIMPAPGDRAGPALRKADELLQRVGSTHGTVLLVSDGVHDPADSLEAIQTLRRRGVRVAVLGIGTLAGAPVPAPDGGFANGPGGAIQLARLDETGLMALASAGGGRYQRLNAGQPLALFDNAVDHHIGSALSADRGVQHWVEKGPWLLLPLLAIAALGFRRGWLMVLVLFMLPPPPAQAFSWQDLWLRPDQQASRLLEQGDATAAAEHFKNPQWRATARYQAGDYPAAAREFTGEQPDSMYNRATALARAGQLQEALTAYQQVLDRQPDSKDARFNHDLVAKLLQQQQSGKSGKQQGQQAQSGQSGKQQGQQAQSGQSGRQQNNQQTGSSPRDTAQAQAGTNGQNSESDKVQSQAAGNDQHTQQARASAAMQNPANGQQQKPADNAARARADVTPAAKNKAAKSPATAATQAEGATDRQVATAGDGQPPPQSEQDLALEQWLHQVPDDPAGLLRRKFMLEHLLRQKGREIP